jgi:glycosyltransferase involved in cell wall biosynthesis
MLMNDETIHHPARYDADALPADRFNVLHVGALEREAGADLLAEAFLIAHYRDPRLHLVLAGTGPEEGTLRRRLASAVTFLGELGPDELAVIYASADLLMFVSAAEAFPQPILEAQASGLPVLAVISSSASELIEDGRSGCLVPPEPDSLACALRSLSRRDVMRDRLSTGGLLSARARTWGTRVARAA